MVLFVLAPPCLPPFPLGFFLLFSPISFSLVLQAFHIQEPLKRWSEPQWTLWGLLPVTFLPGRFNWAVSWGDPYSESLDISLKVIDYPQTRRSVLLPRGYNSSYYCAEVFYRYQPHPPIFRADSHHWLGLGFPSSKLMAHPFQKMNHQTPAGERREQGSLKGVHWFPACFLPLAHSPSPAGAPVTPSSEPLVGVSGF